MGEREEEEDQRKDRIIPVIIDLDPLALLKRLYEISIFRIFAVDELGLGQSFVLKKSDIFDNVSFCVAELHIDLGISAFLKRIEKEYAEEVKCECGEEITDGIERIDEEDTLLVTSGHLLGDAECLSCTDIGIFRQDIRYHGIFIGLDDSAYDRKVPEELV